MSDVAIRVENISKRYTIGKTNSGSLRETIAGLFSKNGSDNIEEFYALRDVSFEVKRGEAIGIIGKNGAGKSTLLKILSRITEPTTGRIEIDGRVSSLLEVGTGFHPELTGRENVFLNGTILGMSRAEVKRKFDEIVDFSGVEKFLDTPVKRYSSGMTVRLAFAVAAHLEPEVLIIDEVLAVGDAEFQKKCLGKMQDVAGEGRTVIFVSHSMGAIQSLCNRAILFTKGKLLKEGTVSQVIEAYLAQENRAIGSIESVSNRTGTQKAIFSGFHLENTSGRRIDKILSGQDVVFKFRVKINDSCQKINLGFSIHNYFGDTLSVLYSGYQSEYFTFTEKGYPYISCTIRNIALSPGKYIVKGRIEENDTELDWLKEKLGYIEVEMGDYYGTGSVGYSGNIPMLVKGEWE